MEQTKEFDVMMRDLVLWFAGVPIIVIIALHMFGLLH